MNVQEQRQAQSECDNGIRYRDLQKQLCLRKERTSGRIFRKTVELEVMKQIELPLDYGK
jgi:hypothetical protein